MYPAHLTPPTFFVVAVSTLGNGLKPGLDERDGRSRVFRNPLFLQKHHSSMAAAQHPCKSQVSGDVEAANTRLEHLVMNPLE